MYVHNAVGLIFTPVGMPHQLMPVSLQHAALQPQALHDRVLVSGLRLCLDGRAPYYLTAPSPFFPPIAIAFSMVLRIPVWTVVYNFFATMQGAVVSATRKRGVEIPDVRSGFYPPYLSFRAPCTACAS